VKSAQWKGTIEMPRLGRLAIAAENPAKRAAFYQQVFELDRIGDHEEAIFFLTAASTCCASRARRQVERPKGFGL
jgi:catechol-2,3-dioxygenase